MKTKTIQPTQKLVSDVVTIHPKPRAAVKSRAGEAWQWTCNCGNDNPKQMIGCVYCARNIICEDCAPRWNIEERMCRECERMF